MPEDTMLEATMPEDTMPENTMPENTMPEDTMPEDTMPEDTMLEGTMPEESPNEEALTRVQALLLDSFEWFLEDVRVFDEDALTQEQKLTMVKELEMQLGLRA